MMPLQSRLNLIIIVAVVVSSTCWATGILDMSRRTLEGYSPGSTLDITLTLSVQEGSTLTGLGVEETLPAGWTFDSLISGTLPDMAPTEPVEFVEFVWDPVPTDIEFTYRVNVPGDALGAKEISGRALYRVLGMAGERQTGIIVTPVAQSSLSVLSVVPSYRTLAASGGVATFSIETDAAWTVVSDQNWAQPSSESGIGPASLSVTCEPNGSVEREAILTVFGTDTNPPFISVSITQESASVAPSLSVLPATRNISMEGGTTSFTITTTADWQASCNSSWAVLSADSGTGETELTVTCEKNVGAKRTATITVAGTGTDPGMTAVTVVQNSASVPLSATPLSRSISAVEGFTTFDVATTAEWQASSNQTWAEVTPASGTGSATLTVNVQENTGPKRTAIITVTGKGTSPQSVAIVITQATILVPLSVAPASRNVPANAGSTTFTIITTAPWEVSSDQTWASFPSVSGIGDTELSVAYTANPTAATRTATITVSGVGTNPAEQNVVLIQAPSNEVEGEILEEGEVAPEGEGESLIEGEGEIQPEGEGETPVEGEGEMLPEGEGEVPVEGEGEPTLEGEGEPMVEGEGEDDTCGCCNSSSKSLDTLLGDWLMISLALMALTALSIKRER